MRIALVHMRHAAVGGTERYLSQLAAWLAERGHDVTILCRSHEESPHPDVRFEVLHGFALGGAARMWRFARDVERRLRQGGFDVVYGLGKTWSQDVIRLGGGCQATYLELAHDATLERAERFVGGGRRKHRLALEIERRALAPGACSCVVTNSDMVRRDVVERYAVPVSRLRTIYNGVDVTRFHPRLRPAAGRQLRAALGLGADELVVLFLGSGYGRKGLDLVLDACARLFPRHPRARLVVAGFDSARERYEARAREQGLDAAVRFLGGRRDAEVVYAAADLYVLPTRYDPFANSTLEALASGLPVVTSTRNGGAELLEEGRHGAVAEPSVDALETALAGWLDRERIEDARGAVRALAEQHDAGSKLRETEALLHEVAGASPAAAVERRP